MTYTLRDLESLETRELLTGQYTLGRDALNDFPLDGDGISRHHAWLHNAEDAVWLMDAGSTNGTRLHDERIAANEWVQIHPGDVIVFGSAGYRLENAIVGDESLEGQLPPDPAPAEDEPTEQPAADDEPPADEPAAETELPEPGAEEHRPAPEPDPNKPRTTVIPRPAQAPKTGSVQLVNGGANLVPPQAPSLQAKRPVARIELPSDPEPTIALPEVELEAAQREVDRLVERANFIAQSRRLDIQTGKAQREANFRSNVPPLRRPGAQDQPQQQAGAVRQDDRDAARRIQTDRMNPAQKPGAKPAPKSEAIRMAAKPVAKPAAVVEPEPLDTAAPKTAPAVSTPQPKLAPKAMPKPGALRPAPAAKPASAPISVPAATKAPAPIAPSSAPAEAPAAAPAPVIQTGATLAEKLLYGGIGMAVGVGAGILIGLYVLGG